MINYILQHLNSHLQNVNEMFSQLFCETNHYKFVNLHKIHFELSIKKLFSLQRSVRYLFTSTVFTFNCWLFVLTIVFYVPTARFSFLGDTAMLRINLVIILRHSSDLKWFVRTCKTKCSGEWRNEGFQQSSMHLVVAPKKCSSWALVFDVRFFNIFQTFLGFIMQSE